MKAICITITKKYWFTHYIKTFCESEKNIIITFFIAHVKYVLQSISIDIKTYEKHIWINIKYYEKTVLKIKVLFTIS